MASDLEPIDFPKIPDHARGMGAMAQTTRGQAVASFDKSRNDLTRGSKSRFRGVARTDYGLDYNFTWNRHEGTSKWQAWTPSGEHMVNIFETEAEAAIAFDLACIKQKGYQAITNYDIRYYNVQAMINGSKPELSQMEVETPCPVTAALAQVYPHRINTDDAGYSNTMQPTIYRARGFRPAKGLPNFPAILGPVKQDNGSGLRFKHGDFSPFNFYQRQQVRQPEVRNVAFGPGHATAFQSFKQTETGDHQCCTFALRPAQNPRSLLPTFVNFESEQRLNTAGRLGFKHSSTSRFKVYRRNTACKGKAKVNF
ncbi:hypothetical protein SADUNF_Sadunf06G0040700 [Salix dunnii]|uniref:AP2/ERF domain-containing protein n=1 Tax=Salix dunnii TaxID=1413687 RepID=A0A835K305_9ROSI|nr:hypothetical protein SADUNF_Sadunf06G0040700 [Salix dunnii]